MFLVIQSKFSCVSQFKMYLIVGEGDAYDVEGSMAILMGTDDAKKFHIYYFKDGLFKEKC